MTILLGLVLLKEVSAGGKISVAAIETAVKNDKELQKLANKNGLDLNLQLFGGNSKTVEWTNHG